MDITKIVQEDDAGDWFPLEQAEKVKIKIRKLKPKDLKFMRKQAMQRKFTNGHIGQTFDNESFGNMILDKSVVDWEGIEMDGKPLPCTKENKELLNDNWAAFSGLWNKVVAEILADDYMFMEELQGN